MADDGDLQQREHAAVISSIAAVPVSTEQSISGVRSPQARFDADEGEAGASPDVCVHNSADGITVRMRPLDGEVEVRLERSYMG
jgi:hypothetical protein